MKIVSPFSRSKAELRRGRGYYFFTVMLFRPPQWIQGFVLFGHYKEAGTQGRRGRTDYAGGERIINIFLHGLSFEG